MAAEARPLRVLYLITDLGKGGAERFLVDLGNQLLERDDVEFIIGSLFDQDLYGSLTSALPIEQLHFQTFSLRGQPTCPAYADLLARFRPHVVHTHRFLAEFLSSYYVSTDIAYVCHGHDNMEQLQRPSWRTLRSRQATTNLLERRYLIRHKYNRVPTVFLANSTHTFEYYHRVLRRCGKVDVIFSPYGFNYARFFNPTPDPPAGGERLRLINVGSFQEKKNQLFIVDIARELSSRGVDFEVDLLGEGERRSAVQAAVEAAGLTDHVLFHGNVDRVESWLTHSHIYLHTARYEPFGLVFLEAMAAGRPCVALDGKGNRDLIQNGRNGFLLEREDASLFADRILELALDRTLYREISSFAQEFAKRYDIGAATDRLVDLYHARTRAVCHGVSKASPAPNFRAAG